MVWIKRFQNASTPNPPKIGGSVGGNGRIFLATFVFGVKDGESETAVSPLEKTAVYGWLYPLKSTHYG